MKFEGELFRNECGAIEHWRDGYYWFSPPESIPVILRNGIKARIEIRS
jgi:hypothetical protein